MHWKFPTNFIGGGQDQPSQQNLQDMSSHSWYPPPSVAGSSPGSSRPSTPGSFSTSTTSMHHRDGSQTPSLGQPSPAEAAGVIAKLKDKSVDELRKLLNDQDAYQTFFQSLDQVKTQNSLRDELRKETLQLAKENLEKEPRIMELHNQCMIIRTTELAAAQEKLSELERQKEEILRFYSPSSILQKLHDLMEKTDDESEALQRQFLAGDIDMTTFIQRYKKLRTLYHKRALIHLAAKTSV